MKPISNDLLGTQVLQEKSPRSILLPSQEKKQWTSMAVENQKFAAHGRPELQWSGSWGSSAQNGPFLISHFKCMHMAVFVVIECTS